MTKIELIASAFLVAMFVAYMIFLVYTWQQMLRDRSAALAKVDAIIDKLPKPESATADDST